MNVTLEHPTGSILVAYGLGQLADHELLDVDAHLAECDLCRQVVEGVAPDTLLTLLRNAPTDSESTSSRNGCHHPTAATQELAAVPPPPELATHPRYRVGELLGVGGMGAVYKAEHLLMERPVALKVLNPKLLDKPATIERFRREVRAAARLTHPNIVTAFDAEQAGDVHYLVMEYVEGTSLARRSTERGPLPITDACDYIRQAALGLEHAHERGMVHRDIKPHNLMLTPAGQVKILDFGLARFAMESGEADTSLSVEMEPIAAPSEDRRPADLPSPPVLRGRGAGGEGAEPAENSNDHERLIPALPRPAFVGVPGGEGGRSFTGHRSAAIRLTHTGLVMGTPDYIAPEQARDSHLADIRSDIYSLGCTLYELLAGQPPFPDGNALHKVKGHLSRTPQPLDTLRRDVPSELLRIVDRMMAKDPAQRYQGPADVAKALAPFVAAPPKRPRRKWKVALAACAACLFIALAGVIYVQTDRGTIVIETNDEKIAVMIQIAGGVKIVDQTTKREYILKRGENTQASGAYQIEVTDPAAGFEFETKKFEIKRGDVVRLTAKFVPDGDWRNGIRMFPSFPALPTVFSHDFRGRGDARAKLPDQLKPFNLIQPDLVQQQPTGLELRIPKSISIDARDAVGVQTTFGLTGDFEITAAYEIDPIEEPSSNYGVGVGIYLAAPGSLPGANFARVVRGKSTQGILWSSYGPTNGEGFVACADTVVRLRYRRMGGTLSYQWAPGTRGEAFQPIHGFEFGTSDIGHLRFAVFTAGSKSSITARLLELQIRGQSTVEPGVRPAKVGGQHDGGPLYLGKPASFWLNQLQDAAPQYRLEALDALGSLAAKNKELVPVIVSVLKDGAGFTRDKETRYVGSVASSILVDLGPDVLPEILKYVDRKSNTALNNAANAIARFGPKAAAAVPLLTQALKTNDLRREAMYALVNIGPAAKPAIPAIIDLLGDALESKEVLESLNERAAIKQDVFGKKGGKGGPASRPSSEGPTWPVVILSSLLNIDPEIKGVLPMEMYIVNPPRRYPQYYGLTFDNGNSEVTSNASVVLWKQTYDILRKQYATQQSNTLSSKQPMTGPASDSASRPASKDEVPMAPMPKWVDSPLGFVEAGPWYLGKPASHWLKQLEDAAPKFRLEAVAALGSISEKNHGVVPSLIASLKDRDLEVATKTSQVLRALGPDVIPDLLKFVDQSSPDALRHAADAIGPIGSKGKAAVPMLTAALRQENWAARRAAADALARIGSDAKPAVPAIVAVLGRALEEKEVIEQIERFGPPAEAKGGGDDPLGKGSSEAPSKVKAGDPFGGKGQGGGGIGKKGPVDPNQLFDQLARNRPYFLISEAPPQLRNPLMAFAKDKQLTSEQITRDQFSQFYPNQDQYRALAGAIIRSQAAAGGDPRIQQGGGQGGNPADGLARFAENDFRNRDVNQDNLLNFDEMPEALRDELQRWDVTRDGLINIDEYKAYFAAMAGRNANGGSGGKAKGNFPAGGFNVNSGLPRHMAIELLDDLLLIDPEIKGSLPEGILNAGVLRTRSGINMEAPLALWKQTHEALAKKYPNHPQPFDPFAISPLPQIPNDGGLKQKTAASEPVYKGRPAAFWLEQFKDRDPSTRIEALLALRAIWPKDERIIPVLVTALTDANEKVGSAAVTAFGAYGPGAVPALLGVLKDQSSVLGMSRAATALGRIGQPAKAAIPLLRQALKIDNWNVRRSSIVALGRMGPGAKAALPELVEVFGLSLESQEGVQQQSPGSRPSGAHPGWTSFDRREPQRGSPEDINASDA